MRKQARVDEVVAAAIETLEYWQKEYGDNLETAIWVTPCVRRLFIAVRALRDHNANETAV